MQPFLISEDFNSHNVAGLVIVALENLAETALSNDLFYLKSVADVVLDRRDVLAVLGVEAIILSVFLGILLAFFLLFFFFGILINVVNGLKFCYFSHFEFCQIFWESLQKFLAIHRERRRCHWRFGCIHQLRLRTWHLVDLTNHDRGKQLPGV